MDNGDDTENHFFGPILDITLLIAALISSLISLTVPCLYYLKKECRQHPMVLIANISLLQAMTNFNIILMAFNMYGFQKFLDIREVFNTLTFNLIPNADDKDFCIYNYYIYMLFQLVSISFHICYSIDLFITIKYPFYAGKKRRKIYYLFSIIFPILTLASSQHDAEVICDELKGKSIFYIPLWFLISLIIFSGISVIIIIFSFLTKPSQSEIRKSYIRQHRTALSALVLFWVFPMWVNIKINILDNQENSQADPINILAFFSLVISSGIIVLIRMFFDKYLRKRILILCNFKRKKRNNFETIVEQQYVELPTEKVVNDQVWNLPLSGAMSQFQSQEVVHNIIQVVCEACSNDHNRTGRESVYRDSVNENHLYESVYRNTILVEEDEEIDDMNFIQKILKERNHQKIIKKHPDECDITELKELSMRKRVFNMVCTTHSKACESPDLRLKQKTIKIKSQEDNKSVEPSEHLPENSSLDIKVTSYSHRIFDCLRKNDGFMSEKIEQSLDLQKNVPNIKKAKQSLGASGSFFFFSYDHKLVIKTISEDEKDKMIEILPQYYEHLKYQEHSLLTRVYGIFSIEIAQISKIYFMMMENTLKDFSSNNIEHVLYDLKGSTVQREVKDQNAPVLKDINYFRSHSCFIYMTRENKVRLIDIITKDLQMLKKFNIMDYSLLLAVGKSKVKRKRSDFIQMGEDDKQYIQNYRYIKELQSLTKRIYCISIIDFLQEFNTQKKMELWLKRIFKGGGDISSVDTQIYFDRFMKFIKRITVTFNLQPNSKNTDKSRSSTMRGYSRN